MAKEKNKKTNLKSRRVVERSGSNRRSSDRRSRKNEFDEYGNVKAGGYNGPDRRSSLDRREYIEKQNRRISRERAKFFKGVFISFLFTTVPVIALMFFLLEPEYLKINKMIKTTEHLVSKVSENNKKDNKNISFSGILNSQIEKIENIAKGYDVDKKTEGNLRENINNPINSLGVNNWAKKLGGYIFYSGRDGVSSLKAMLDRLSNLRYGGDEGGGEVAVYNSINSLRSVLSNSIDNPETITSAVNLIRRSDGVLNKMLGDVGSKNIAAGAMLIVMNEFRNNVYSGRPYEEDLAFLRKISGNDPEMNKALSRLSPYAKSGIMNRRTLQREFGGLTKDIILARMRGEDISIKEQTLARFDNLLKKGAASKVKGTDTAAVVARAKLLLDRGDVNAAMAELQSLKGASAQTAMPWMQGAAGSLMANQQSDEIIQNVLQSMGGASGLPIGELIKTMK